MDRRDIEFNAEGVILRGWLYRGEGVSGQTWATCSVNVCRGHVSTRQRQRRSRHCTCAISPPDGRSRGRLSTHSFPDVDLTAHVGQRAASESAVTSCTIFAPAAERATRSAARPSSPNRHDASSLPLTTARGSPLAAPRHSEDQGGAGRPRLRVPNRPSLRLPGQARRAAKRGKHLFDVLVMLTGGQPWLSATSKHAAKT